MPISTYLLTKEELKKYPDHYFEVAQKNGAKLLENGDLELDIKTLTYLAKEFNSYPPPVVSFIKSMSRWVKQGLPVVDKNEQQRRLDICERCPFFTGTTCKLCGCFTKFKTKLLTEKCPDGRW